MTTPHFIRDNTSLGDADLPNRMANPAANKKVVTQDWQRFVRAMYDIQEYLNSGAFDASVTISAKDINLVNNADANVGPELDWVGNRGRWFIGVDVANSPTSRDFVLAGQRGPYSFSDGATTSGSPTLTSASGGGFAAALVGSPISGVGIPAGTTVSAVASTTSLTMSANATATATGVTVTIARSASADIVYLKHRGGLSPTIGFGITPPDGSARLQVSPNDAEPAMGTIRLRRGPSQTGNVLALHDSTPIDRWWVDKDFYVSGEHSLGGAMVLQGNAANNRPLLMIDKDKSSSVYGFEFPAGGGGVIRFVRTTTGTNVFQVGTDGSLFIYNAVTMQSSLKVQGNIGFYNATPVARPTITGSRGSNAAVASLLTALALQGLIIDGTTA